jgi:hypothetical protein
MKIKFLFIFSATIFPENKFQKTFILPKSHSNTTCISKLISAVYVNITTYITNSLTHEIVEKEYVI